MAPRQVMIAALASLVGAGALAAPPDRVAKRYDLANTEISKLAVSDDERLVAGVTTSGKIVVVDAETWASAIADPCDATSVALQKRTDREGSDAGDGYFVYVGCDNGQVLTWRWINDTLREFTIEVEEDTTDNGGSLFDTDSNDTDSSLFDTDTEDSTDTTDTTTNVGEPEEILDVRNPISGLWLPPGDSTNNPDGYLVALAEPNGDVTNLYIIDLATAKGQGTALSADSFTKLDLLERGYKEGVIVSNAAGVDQLYVAHGNEDFTVVSLPIGSQLNNFSRIGLNALDPRDLTPSDLGGVYIADLDLGLAVYSGVGGGLSPNVGVIDPSFTALRSIVETRDQDRLAYEYFVVQDDDVVRVFDPPNGAAVGEEIESFDAAFAIQDMVEGPYGIVFAATSGGKVAVLTARPFLENLSLSPGVGVSGQTVEVTFDVDLPGTWRIYRGGGRETGGVELSSGTVTDAGTVVVSFDVDDAFEEGDNDIWIRHTASSNGERGWIRGEFTVDNPPKAVVINSGSIGFADKALIVSFNALDVDDVARYDVYLRETAFRDDRWETGGPTGAVSGGASSPVAITAEEGQGRISYRIENLQNSVTYYLAVRAVDASEQESPMSNVVSGMPRPTCLAAECAGEPGGCAGCSTSGDARWLGLAGLLAGLAMIRRRASVLGAAVVAAVLLVAPMDAVAGEQRGLHQFDRDTTPAWANFEFRWGMFAPADPFLQKAYGDRSSEFRISFGPQIFRFLELDLGVGLFNKKGFQLSDDGKKLVSGDAARFQMVPLSAGFTLRVHVLDEQPFVPFASVGLDYAYYRDTKLDTEDAPITTGEGNRVVGSKGGWHWEVGGQILLDWLAPRRASVLEASTGINDTWLTIAYHQQNIGKNTPGLDLSGWSLQVGLQLDY